MSNFSLEKAISSFNSRIKQLLSPKTPENYLRLCSFVKGLLIQYKLNSTTDADEVINESILRGFLYIKNKQKEIEYLLPFLKRVSLNVVREMHRKRRKLQGGDLNQFLDEIVADNSVNYLPFEDFSDRQIQSLRCSLQKLSTQEHQILYLWKVEELSWKEIVQVIDEERLSIDAAKKRGERILKKLRKEVNMQ